jgi:ubiquinone/menaquinone biosynthesis C-methylase UbiE
VDFGCGVGRYAIPLSQAIGADGSVKAVERDTGDLHVLQHRIPEFPTGAPIDIVHSHDYCLTFIKDASTDAVLAFDVLQYVTDWSAFFMSVKRILRPSGVLHIYPAAIPHPNVVDLDLMERSLVDAGFRLLGRNTFTMMHNMHMVEDTVHSYSVQDNPRGC